MQHTLRGRCLVTMKDHTAEKEDAWSQRQGPRRGQPRGCWPATTHCVDICMLRDSRTLHANFVKGGGEESSVHLLCLGGESFEIFRPELKEVTLGEILSNAKGLGLA